MSQDPFILPDEDFTQFNMQLDDDFMLNPFPSPLQSFPSSPNQQLVFPDNVQMTEVVNEKEDKQDEELFPPKVKKTRKRKQQFDDDIPIMEDFESVYNSSNIDHDMDIDEAPFIKPTRVYTQPMDEQTQVGPPSIPLPEIRTAKKSRQDTEGIQNEEERMEEIWIQNNWKTVLNGEMISDFDFNSTAHTIVSDFIINLKYFNLVEPAMHQESPMGQYLEKRYSFSEQQLKLVVYLYKHKDDLQFFLRKLHNTNLVLTNLRENSSEIYFNEGELFIKTLFSDSITFENGQLQWNTQNTIEKQRAYHHLSDIITLLYFFNSDKEILNPQGLRFAFGTIQNILPVNDHWMNFSLNGVSLARDQLPLFQLDSFFYSPRQWPRIYPEMNSIFIFQMIMEFLFNPNTANIAPNKPEPLANLIRNMDNNHCSLDDFVYALLDAVGLDNLQSAENQFINFVNTHPNNVANSPTRPLWLQFITAKTKKITSYREFVQGNNLFEQWIQNECFYKLIVDFISLYVQTRDGAISTILKKKPISMQEFLQMKQDDLTILTTQWQHYKSKKDIISLFPFHFAYFYVTPRGTPPQSTLMWKIPNNEFADLVNQTSPNWLNFQSADQNELIQLLSGIIDNHSMIRILNSGLVESSELALSWDLDQTIEKTNELKVMLWIFLYLTTNGVKFDDNLTKYVIHPFFIGPFGGQAVTIKNKIFMPVPPEMITEMDETTYKFKEFIIRTPFLKYPYHIQSLMSPTSTIRFPNVKSFRVTERLRTRTNDYYTFLQELVQKRNYMLNNSISFNSKIHKSKNYFKNVYAKTTWKQYNSDGYRLFDFFF